MGDPSLAAAEKALHDEFRRLYSEWKLVNLATGQRRGGDPIKWGYSNVPLNNKLYLLYAGLDSIYVRRLLDILDHLMRKRQMARLSRREQRISRLSTGMQTRGCLVDVDYTQALYDEENAAYQDADNALIEATGCRHTQKAKISDWLTERSVKGARSPKTNQLVLTVSNARGDKGAGTDMGAERFMSLEGELGTVNTLIGKHWDDEEVRDVLIGLYETGTRKNLLTNLAKMLRCDADGFVHPRINTMQAVTGRMSISDPPLQTFKKEDKRLRGCGIARPGFVLVRADFDNQEVRLAAALSRDPALLRIVRDGLNQHEITAASVYPGMGIDPKTGKIDHDSTPYKASKVLDFAQQYGAGPRRIALQLGVPLPEAYDKWYAWRDTYARLVTWSEEEAGKLWVINEPWHRVIPRDRDRWVTDKKTGERTYQRGRYYANGNYKIQSSGRDMLGDALIRLDEWGWTEALWLPIHDEIVLEVPEYEAENAVKALEAAMHTNLKGVEFTASATILGHRWSGE
jgi:DNA polymerase-1